MPQREISALVALLADDNRDVAAAARKRLVDCGDAALTALDDAALADDARLRRVARDIRDEMLGARAEAAFAESLRAADIDLETAAIELARVERPSLDAAALRARFDELGARVAARAAEASTFYGRAAALGEVLHGEEGLKGNADDYYRPQNSYVDWVLDLKKGIPISLSLLYVFVGKRAGLDVFGVGLPRHFVAGIREGDATLYVDAFNGGSVLDREEAQALLVRQNLPAHASLFAEAAPRDVVRRMLANLAFAYRDRRDEPRSARIGRLLGALEAGRARA
jgi:regulator of sirC expression with transglutaminase-like and TPR domain